MYGTICSLVWESRGSPELWYASTRFQTSGESLEQKTSVGLSLSLSSKKKATNPAWGGGGGGVTEGE